MFHNEHPLFASTFSKPDCIYKSANFFALLNASLEKKSQSGNSFAA